MTKKILSYAVIVISSIVAALCYKILVFPNSFAPSGVNGICTIIQTLLGINIGYLSALINIPLAILVFFKVSRTLAVRSLTYVFLFSVLLILFEKIDFSGFIYQTDNGTSKILGPLIAGIVMGCVSAIMLKTGAYCGGSDFISLLIHTKNPGKSVFYISFFINAAVALLSYFVYGHNIEPVFLCIVYAFACSTVADKAMRSGRSAIRFTIITKSGPEICDEIIRILHHSATIVPCEGAYSHQESQMIVCIVNKGQVGLLQSILKKYSGTFATMDPVSEIYGNFKKIDKKGNHHQSVLDKGDKEI